MTISLRNMLGAGTLAKYEHAIREALAYCQATTGNTTRAKVLKGFIRRLRVTRESCSRRSDLPRLNPGAPGQAAATAHALNAAKEGAIGNAPSSGGARGGGSCP